MKLGGTDRRTFIQTVYLYVVGLTGFAILTIVLPATIRNSDLGLIVFVAMGVLCEWAHVPLARGTMTLSFSVILPCFILYGPGGAYLVEIIGYLIGGALFDSRGWRVRFFNCGQYVLTVSAASVGSRLVGGISASRLGPPDILAIAVFTVIYFVVNHLLVGIWFTVSHPKESVSVIWGEPAKWEGFTYLITAPLGVAAITLYTMVGLLGAASLFFVSLVAAFIFRLAFRLDHLNRELRALYESAQALGRGLDLEGVKDQVFASLERVAPCETATLFLWDDVGQVLRAVDSRPGAGFLFGRCLALGETVIGQAAERRTVEVADVARVSGLLPAGSGPVPGSLAVAPMVAEDRLVGVLVLGATAAGTYTEEHARLLTIFAGQAGAALRRALRYQETRQMAITDSKTGVYNYRFFYERLIDEIKRHEAKSLPFSLIFVDVDYLKGINDRFGHQVGDEILKQVATLIKTNVRDTDEVARYGGEEFVVLLPAATGEESLIVAERIRKSVEAYNFAAGHGFGPVRVTITAGVATYPEHATQPDELIFRADEAMYYGKHRGRNRVSLYAGTGVLAEIGPA